MNRTRTGKFVQSTRRKPKRIFKGKRQCPRGCGATWCEYVYVYGGGACLKTWWNREGKDFSPLGNKACVTYRVEKDANGKWRIAKNPAWAKDTWPVKRCC